MDKNQQFSFCQVRFTLIAKIFLGIMLLFISANSHAQVPWTLKKDMGTAKCYFGACVLDGKIYVIGGAPDPWNSFSVVEEYDPSTNTWTTETGMPTARFGLSTSVVDGKIYAIGGTKGKEGNIYWGLNKVEAYDPVAGTWTTKAPMPTARYGLSTSVVDGKIYAIGGSSGLSVYGVVNEYDPSTDTWSRKADMPTARWGFSSSEVDGKIYVIGGSRSNHLHSESIVEVYDPVTDTWSQKADMPTPRWELSTATENGKIYAIGGESGTGGFNGLSVVEVYNTVTDAWVKGAKMPTQRRGLSTSVVDGKIYAMGGAIGMPGPSFATVEEYDPHEDLRPLIENINTDKTFAVAGNDRVCIQTRLYDPVRTTLFAEIESPDQTPIDNMRLYDDGNHNDGEASDNLYANVWDVQLTEEQDYFVDLTVTKVDTDTVIHHIDNMAMFTTIGPVVLAHPFGRAIGDDLPESGDLIKMRLSLKNNAANATAENVKARIVCSNEFISITSDEQSFGEIATGMEKENSGYYRFQIDEKCPVDEIFYFRIDISSNEYFCWSDSFEVQIGVPIGDPVVTVSENQGIPVAYTLCQNYPNPFNPITQIEFSLPKPAEVKLATFNTAGRLVTTLANRRFEQGNHKLIFDGREHPSGLYVYRLSTFDFTQQRKMILMK